jgi:pimeloyl-ACP methyl ester carboxylesterase
MSDNWVDIAKSFSDTFKVYLSDLRNHGNSPHDAIHTYTAMSEDIVEFMNEHNIQSAFFIGHSMGGKLLMHFANRYPERIEKMIVVDISPRIHNLNERMETKKDMHKEIISILFEINEKQFKDRKLLHEYLDVRIPDLFTQQLIQKNLRKNSEQTYETKINIEAIDRYFDEIGGEIILGENVLYLNVMFLFGSESPYHDTADEIYIREKMPYSQIKVVKNAGHLVHIENRNDFLKLSRTFFDL